MRNIFFIALLSLSIFTQGQIIKSGIVGSWMKINAMYNSGENLPNDNQLNQSFLRLRFGTDGKATKELDPYDEVFIFDYSISDYNLKIGYVNYKINYLANDTLIITEVGKNGINDFSIKYVFVSEDAYQQNISLTPDMIILSGKDSIFIENKTFIPHFENDMSFHDFLRKNIPDFQGTLSNGYFMATFIITKNGGIDSIKIHKGYSKSFDNQFLKAVNKSANRWTPAKFKNRNVNVLHIELYEFFNRNQFSFFNLTQDFGNGKKYLNYEEGIIAMLRSDFERAIGCFSKVLESNPKDKDALFQRGNCYHKLGDINKACLDWSQVKHHRSKMADNSILQFCK